MSYATSDFAASLDRVSIAPATIETVIAAWGGGDGQGTDGGPGWSEEPVTDWSGGFLFKLKDGRHCYVCGWCDYTGWGCQDGAEVQYFDILPALDSLESQEDYRTKPHDWDLSPADLNKWLADGAKEIY